MTDLENREAFNAWIAKHPDSLDLTSYEKDIMFDTWKAAIAQTVPINNTTIVAVERMVEQQVEASGITADVFRLDGEKILNAAVEAARGGK